MLSLVLLNKNHSKHSLQLVMDAYLIEMFAVFFRYNLATDNRLLPWDNFCLEQESKRMFKPLQRATRAPFHLQNRWRGENER